MLTKINEIDNIDLSSDDNESIDKFNDMTSKIYINMHSTSSDESMEETIMYIHLEIKKIDSRIHKLQNRKQLLYSNLNLLESSFRTQQETMIQRKHDWDSDKFEWSDELYRIAKDYFGIKEFRLNQRGAINAILSQYDTILLMPTGGGKSLCFQIPILMNIPNRSPGLALVISPLLSLMRDQVLGLKALGILAFSLSSETDKEDNNYIRSLMKRLHDPQLFQSCSLPISQPFLQFLYVTPERIAKSKLFMNCLEKIYQANHLRLIVIDEVHCVSKWGHSFRQDYQHLSILKTHFPTTPILCLTATATPTVIDDIKTILQIKRCILLKSPIQRSNIFYLTLWKPKKSEDVFQLILNIIQLFPSETSGIIYCLTKKEAQQLCETLCSHSIRAVCYNGDLSDIERSVIYNQWISNKAQVVVATVAFGMGINKGNVRYVIHHTLPRSIDCLYQEAGRAGRDGYPALSIVLYRTIDVTRQSTMIYWEPNGLSLLYQLVSFFYLSLPSFKSPKHLGCRHKYLSYYFADPVDTLLCNRMCDNCFQSQQRKQHRNNEGTQSKRLKMESVIDTTQLSNLNHHHLLDFNNDIKVGLELLKEAKQTPNTKYTLLKFTQLWRKRIKSSSTLHSSDSHIDIENLLDISMQLLVHGLLQEDFAHTPYSTISYCSISKQGLNALEIGILPTQIYTLPLRYYQDPLATCSDVFHHLFSTDLLTKTFSYGTNLPTDILTIEKTRLCQRLKNALIQGRDSIAVTLDTIGSFIINDYKLNAIVKHCVYHRLSEGSYIDNLIQNNLLSMQQARIFGARLNCIISDELKDH